jgi:hypothetical protein
MEKEFIAYEQALALKELGFDEPCFKYIYVGDTGNNIDHYLEVVPSKAKNYNEDSLSISQPTFSQSFRWFREKHGLVIVIKPIADKRLELGYNLTKNGLIMGAYTTYEKAELACLKNLIEISKNK